jgi:SAM-dependent methyltransferase
LDLSTFEALFTPAGQAVLSEAAELGPSEETFLADLTRLQKRYPSELAKAALETVILRARAQRKFSRAGQMYFSREALEQSSGEAVARYRGARYAPFSSVGDLACGLGGDALGLADTGSAYLTLVDFDPLRLALARANLAAGGHAGRATFVCADLTSAPLPAVEALWFDPARREQGRRVFSVDAYHPPLSIINSWLVQRPAMGVKISPGVDLAELAGYAAETEFISEAGELKESVLWFGALRSAPGPGSFRRATLLPGPHTLLADPAAVSTLSAPQAYLYEPDPAILRAGLVTTLAAQINARQIDSSIGYLTSETLTPTPFARAFAIEAALPFQLKRLRAALRARGVGQVTVKKRGSPLEPEALIRQLKLSGPESRIVFLTQVSGKPYALIGRAC